MVLNCGVGEDFWESFGQQGYQTSQNIHGKDWCWSTDTLATWWEQLTHWKKTLMLGKIEGRRRRQRMRWLDGIEWLNEQEFEQTPGVSKRQGNLCPAVPRVAKSQTRLSDWAKATGPSASHSTPVCSKEHCQVVSFQLFNFFFKSCLPAWTVPVSLPSLFGLVLKTTAE